MKAVIKINTINAEEIIMAAMDVKGYSHLGKTYTHAGTNAKVQEIHFIRSGAISLDSELRKKGVYALQIK